MTKLLPGETFELELDLLLEAIYHRYDLDFREYSRASVRRRVLYCLEKKELESVSILQDRVLRDRTFLFELLQYLTVPTSEMFRDPMYFRVMREEVFPHLRTWPSLKIWIPGCSTGEEVYSFAIMLKEENLLDRTLIYATDINPRVLEQAREGVYRLGDIAGFTRAYQQAGGQKEFSDYYVVHYGAARFSRELQEIVHFADHSLVTDNVFAEVQLVSCRNVLIYLNRRLQDRAVGLFRDALCRGGFLGLGSRESLWFSRFADDFEPFDQDQRIYRKVRRE